VSRKLEMKAAITILLASCTLAVFGATESPAVYWTGISAGYRISWTAANLTAKRATGGKLLLDVASGAKGQWALIAAKPGDHSYTAEYTFRLLSVVGPVLSIEEEDDCDCGGAHPTAFRRFHVVDLRHTEAGPAGPTGLDKLFPPEEIRKALLANADIASAVQSSGTPPATLTALLKKLTGTSTTGGECQYALDSNLMESYAFEDYADGTATVQFSLPAAAEVCRGDMKVLSIKLPVPASIKAWFTAASERREGFLKERLSSMSLVEASTHFQFTNEGRKQ